MIRLRVLFVGVTLILQCYVLTICESVDFPPLIDADDIAYFFGNDDMEGLHWALTNIFANSERNPKGGTVPLPEQLVSRGGGARYTTAYKLRHDIEQAQYLAKALPEGSKEANFFGTIVAPTYETILDRIPPLDSLSRTNGLYPFSKADQEDGIASLYNKALRTTDFDELKDPDTGKTIPLLNPNLDVEKIQHEMLSEGVAVVDDLMTPQALARIRQLMLESTVFFQTKMPKVFGGYVGAYIDDGLHDRILLQLAFELYKKFPKIMKGHFLRYLWAYKYDSTLTGINTHADQAAVNVNIWLTPDDANLDPTSGGLVVYTVKPPKDWDFEKFNTATDFVHEHLLEPSGYANKTIPHKQNRAVIFDSALFHHTDNFNFKPGYENRRINLTLLYGKMRMAASANANDEL